MLDAVSILLKPGNWNASVRNSTITKAPALLSIKLPFSYISVCEKYMCVWGWEKKKEQRNRRKKGGKSWCTANKMSSRAIYLRQGLE